MITGPRFHDFREITARRDSTGCVNGADHEIRKGDVIGWARKWRKACCASCWAAWVSENAEADAIENGYMPNPW